MAKLPIEERPPWNDIRDKVYSRVSHKYRQIFVPDFQNDCACAIESYDCDTASDTWYLTAPDKVEKVLFQTRLDLPMIPEISDASIELLLKKAIESVGDKPHPDLLYTAVITNRNSDQISKVQPRNYIDRVVLVDFIPANEFVMIPDPEFFGALSANIGGYGAFCVSSNLYKFKV